MHSKNTKQCRRLLGLLLFVTLYSSACHGVEVNAPFGPVIEKAGCSGDSGAYCDLRVYQVMVESFVNGDFAINYGDGYGTSHHRGDIRGVINSLDYIKNLGLNAVWLTPVFDSQAGTPQERLTGTGPVDLKLDATGYYTRDYFSIDPKFGTFADAQELVTEAHARGMYVFFDGVFGHHKGGLLPSPTGKLPVDSMDPSDYFGNPAGYPGRVVDYDSPATLEFYKEVATYWIEEIGLDGYRLDQSYQVPPSALREIRQAVDVAAAANGTLGYLVAETWLEPQDIQSLSYGPASNPVLDSAFDFNMRYAIVDTIAGDEHGNSGFPASTLNEFWAYGTHELYADHALPNLMLGNHDLLRFGDLLQRNSIADPAVPDYWARHRLAFMVQAAYTGPITRYYGEEIGDEVANYAERVTSGCASQGLCDDHVARSSGKVLGVTLQPFQFAQQQLDLLEFHQELMAIRAEYPSLSHGSRQHLYGDDYLYIDLKTLGDEQIVFAMNLSDVPLPVRLSEEMFAAVPTNAWDLLGDQPVEFDGGYLDFVLQPLSAQYILLADSPRTQAGDFDADHDIDGHDFLDWQRSSGLVGALGKWQSHFGTVAAAAITHVPEPNTICCLVLANVLGFFWRMQR